MRSAMSRFIPAFVIASCPAFLWATGSGPASISLLADRADVIAVASVETFASSSSAVSVSLRVRRGLKGTADGSLLTAVFTTSNGTVAANGLSVGTNGLWFLGADGSGGWTILSSWEGSLFVADSLVPLPAGDLPVQWRYATSDPLIDRIVNELRAASVSSVDETLNRVYAAMGTIRVPSVTVAFEHVQRLGPLHEGACPTARAYREWDSTTLSAVEARPGLGTPGSVPSGLVLGVCQVFDPAAVPALARLMDSGAGDAPLERCVAEALLNIHTEQALPYLARLLDSEDPYLQYLAITGFALFRHDYAIPGPEPNVPTFEAFNNDSATYRELWKQWWTGTGSGIDGGLNVVNGQMVYADATRAALSGSVSAGASSVPVASSAGFAGGQEVLIFHMTGPAAGAHESGTVVSVASGQLNLSAELAHAFRIDSISKAQVIRIANYTSVTVQSGGTLTVNPWNGSTGGVMFLRATGAVTVQSGGVLTVAGKGFAGGAGGPMSAIPSNGGAGGVAGLGDSLSSHCWHSELNPPGPGWCDDCTYGPCQVVSGGVGGTATSGVGAPVQAGYMGRPCNSPYYCYGGNGGGGGVQGSAGASGQVGSGGAGPGGGAAGTGGTNGTVSGAAALMGGGGGGGTGGG